MSELTPNDEIAVLEQFMALCDREHSAGHQAAAETYRADTRKPFVPEEHWAWAAGKAREVARRIRETGLTLGEILNVDETQAADMPPRVVEEAEAKLFVEGPDGD